MLLLCRFFRCQRIVKYFHEDDYALRWWVKNNYLKPDTGQGYHYTGNTVDYLAYHNNNRFYYDSLFTLNDERELRFEENNFEILVFCAESRSKALGAVSYGGILNKAFNLSEVNYNDKHYSHSRQFRSSIVNEWPYWRRFYEDCNFEK